MGSVRPDAYRRIWATRINAAFDSSHILEMNSMTGVVQLRLDDVHGLCAKHHVRRLDLFGSATGQSFDQDASDLDFAVEFATPPDVRLADAYFGLLQDLRSLFGRQVDLVMESAIRNPYFREELNATKVPLYGSAG